MASLDAYDRWLGIPPDEQPPHHYRLLEIDVFESDRKVINGAAKRVLTQLLARVADQESPQMKKLMAEIADARACLMDRRLKADYDQHLSQQIKNNSSSISPMPDKNNASCPSCGNAIAESHQACPVCGYDRASESRQFADTKIGSVADGTTQPESASRAQTTSREGPVRKQDSSPVLPIGDAPTRIANSKPFEPVQAEGPNLTPWLLAACGATVAVIIVLLFVIATRRPRAKDPGNPPVAGAPTDSKHAVLILHVPASVRDNLRLHVDHRPRDFPGDGELQLLAGLHQIRLEAVGYKDFHREVDLSAGDQRTLAVRFEPKPVAPSNNPPNVRPDNPPGAPPAADVLGLIEDERLDEISGLARSISNPGLLWTHNDSNHGALLYLIDQKGKTRGEFEIEGAKSVDWEDISSFTVKDRAYIVVADMGDNNEKRHDCVLYVIAEPSLPVDGERVKKRLRLTKKIEFSYDDRPHNCEAVAVESGTGNILLSTKDEKGGPSIFYTLPSVTLAPPTGNTAKRVAELDLPTIFGMDITTAGDKIALLGKNHAFQYSRRPGEDWENALRRPPLKIEIPPQKKGEAIAYNRTADAIFLTSEDKPTPLYRVAIPQ